MVKYNCLEANRKTRAKKNRYNRLILYKNKICYKKSTHGSKKSSNCKKNCNKLVKRYN